MAASTKRLRYRDFEQQYVLVPLAFETHGPVSPCTHAFLGELAKRINRETGDPRGGGCISSSDWR